MKVRVSTSLFVLLAVTAGLCSTVSASSAKAAELGYGSGHPVHHCGTLALRQLVPMPEAVKPLPPRAAGMMPVVGDTRQFWTYDLSVMPPKNKAIQATCRAVGTDVAVWVGDDEWNGQVVQADVDSVMEAMEITTPLASVGGVFGNNTRLFGMPPVVNEGDPSLTILIYDIPGYQGNVFDGYFRAEDLAAFNASCETSPMIYCSNELPMIHVTSENVGSDYMAGVIAHEFEHLIHFGQDMGEDPWLDESLAELAMIHAGYEDPNNLAYFLAHPESSLVIEPPVDYGACLLFGSYLWELLGDEGILALVQDQASGQTSVEAAVSDLGKTWDGLFAEFALANLTDAPDLDWPLDHSLVDVSGISVGQWGSDFASREVIVPPTATRYYRIAPALGQQALYLSVTGDAAMQVLWWNQASQAGNLTEQLAMDNGEVALGPEIITQGNLYLAFANPTSSPATVTFSAYLGEAPVVEPPVEPVEDVVEQQDLEEQDLQVEADQSSGDAVDAVWADTSDASAQADTVTEPQPKKDSGGCAATSTPASASGLLLLAALALLLAFRRRG